MALEQALEVRALEIIHDLALDLGLLREEPIDRRR